MLCQLCYDNITIIKYKIKDYKNFIYCYECLEILKDTQWDDYIKGLKTDCQASLNRLIELGPPTNYRDFAIENGHEIESFLNGDQIISAKLKGSYEGLRKEIFWHDLKAYDINVVLEKYQL